MKHILSNGTIIIDDRHLGLGITIDNQTTTYVRLSYNKNHKCFYANTFSCYLEDKSIDLYIKELQTVKQLIQEANNYLTK